MFRYRDDVGERQKRRRISEAVRLSKISDGEQEESEFFISWIYSDARIVAGFKSYTDAVAKMPDALNGQLIEITDIENRGRGRRKKKRVKRFHDTFSEDSQSEDNEVPGNSSSIPATAKSQSRNSISELPKSNFPSIPVNLEMDFPSRIRQHSRSSVFANRSPSPKIDQPSNIVETPRAPNAGRKPSSFQERFQLNLSHSRSDGQVIAKKFVPINASPEAAKAFEVVIKKLEYLTCSMEIVKATQREQLSTLSILLRNTAPPELQVNNISKELGFPLNTMASLRSLESTLNEDQAKLKLLNFINGIGGNATSVVGRILRKLMTYGLGSQFCFAGQNEEKKCFRSLELLVKV